MTTYNKSKIFKLAHKLRKDYHLSLSEALREAWRYTKIEVRNNAILAARKAAGEAKRAKENAGYNANYIAGPARYYGNGRYNGD
ncbi:hypothetical protein IR083_20840 [Dysgonomonas sp. GY75]|uniref:hypothetical protein n=1 Tax=Dysgonomonas sp. GY75 TaxID=2780419 RepID=UPI0018840584|nr:hypothetical protein [Dysgonomonas sp. GY75]MBF0651269.1 hypothetical protein [Dysgonomonas sp. GY75]